MAEESERGDGGVDKNTLIEKVEMLRNLEARIGPKERKVIKIPSTVFVQWALMCNI